MNIMEKKTLFRYIAGGIFAVSALVQLLNIVRYFNVLNVFYFIALLLIVAGLFIKNTLISAVGSGLYTVLALYRFISYGAFAQGLVWSLYNIPNILFWLMLLVSLVGNIRALGGVAAGIGIFRFLVYVSIWTRYDSLSSLPFRIVLDLLLPVAGALIMCFAIETVSAKVALNATRTTSSINANTAENIIERLERLKKLLDSGVITQEEFEEEKKNIIGM